MKKKYTSIHIDILFVGIEPHDILTASFEYKNDYAGDIFDWDVFF